MIKESVMNNNYETITAWREMRAVHHMHREPAFSVFGLSIAVSCAKKKKKKEIWTNIYAHRKHTCSQRRDNTTTAGLSLLVQQVSHWIQKYLFSKSQYSPG